MMTPEEIAKLIRTVLRNDNHINILFGIANDFACLIEQALPRCVREGCTAAATVKHRDLDVRFCDRCAARTIVRAKQNIQHQVVDSISHLRENMGDEERWIDLPNAERIRRVCNYVDVLVQDDVSAETPELH